ncbi:6-bladed beta-propeller [Algoriphagus algorifonticola]|uniref:6-bladed beta-propeller n=1 Tax=Algoriphagus algorifonticola TaxID=2593007 RepID=UPI0011AB07A9|nr:6-bladed beta-propeller [Algoriphagus algorifonticola]
MKVKEKSICIGLLWMLISCTIDNEKGGLDSINIPIQIHSGVALSDISTSITLLDLQSNEQVLLDHIFDVKLANDMIFIVESRRISIFNIDGKFIQFLGKYGEGPGEFHRISSLDIDEKSGLIYLSSFNKVLIYNHDFELVNEQKLDFPVQYLKALNDELYVVSEEIGIPISDKFLNKTQLLKLDKSFQILDSLPFRSVLLEKKQLGGAAYRHWVSHLNEETFLFVPVLTSENLIRDTLYQVEDGQIIPSVRFEFERGQSLNDNGYQTLLLTNIINSKSYYILEYELNWERHMVLYNKTKREVFNLKGGVDDQFGDPIFLRPLDLTKDSFFYVKETEYIQKSGVEKNPVIGIVTLK